MRKSIIAFWVLALLALVPSSAWAGNETGPANTVMRVPNAGGIGKFGSMDLSKSAAVGSSVLQEINGGTNQSAYTLGDTLYSSASNTLSKLAGNTTATKEFLTQTGTGSGSAATVWATILAADLPVADATHTGVVNTSAQAFGGVKTFAAGMIPGNNGTGDISPAATSVTLGSYYTGSFTATFTGPCSSSTRTLTYMRIGTMLILNIPAFACTSSVNTTFVSGTGALPSGLRPASTHSGMCAVTDSGTTQASPGDVDINTAGTISISKTLAGGNFTNSGSAGVANPCDIPFNLN